MRIDKYLWCIRVYKTSNIATEACKKGHVKMIANIKPSKEVFGNELLLVRKNQINYQFKVLDFQKVELVQNCGFVSKRCTPKEDFEKTEMLKYCERSTIEKKVLEALQKKIEEILKIIRYEDIENQDD